MQADGRVLLLPLPVDVVDLGVVEVEEGFARAVGCVAGLTKDASDTEVAATVDVGHGERRRSLKNASELCECRLVESALELRWVGEEIEETRCEVTSQT